MHNVHICHNIDDRGDTHKRISNHAVCTPKYVLVCNMQSYTYTFSSLLGIDKAKEIHFFGC